MWRQLRSEQSPFIQIKIFYSFPDGRVISWTVLGGGTKTVATVPMELLEEHSHAVKKVGKRHKHSDTTNIKMRLKF